MILSVVRFSRPSAGFRRPVDSGVAVRSSSEDVKDVWTWPEDIIISPFEVLPVTVGIQKGGITGLNLALEAISVQMSVLLEKRTRSVG